jgi:hypothetical protein
MKSRVRRLPFVERRKGRSVFSRDPGEDRERGDGENFRSFPAWKEGPLAPGKVLEAFGLLPIPLRSFSGLIQRREGFPEVTEAAITVTAGGQVVKDLRRVSRGWNQPVARIFRRNPSTFTGFPSDSRVITERRLQDPLDMGIRGSYNSALRRFGKRQEVEAKVEVEAKA